MFGSWDTIAITPGAGPREADSSGIKKYAGPLTFPGYSTSASPSPSFDAPSGERSFYAYFQKIRRATDVTKKHLDLLNVSVSYGVDVQDMLPGEKVDVASDDFWKERERELLLDNTSAYQGIARIRRDVKVGHMYRFYQAVEMVKGYYMTSEDREKAELESSRAKGMAPPRTEIEMVDAPPVADALDGKRKAQDERRGMEKRACSEPPTPEADRDLKGSPKDASSTLVKADGDNKEKEDANVDEHGVFQMPERFREDLVKNFIEPLCWGYGVRIYPPRSPPKLSFQNSKFSVHLTSHVHWTPLAAAEARAGIVEGPVMGLQVRHEHRFLTPSEAAEEKRKKREKQAAQRKIAPPAPPPPAEEPKKSSSSRRPLPPGMQSRRSSREKRKQEEDEEKKKALQAAGEVQEEPEALDEGVVYVGDDGMPEDVVGIVREVVAMASMAQERQRTGEEEKKVRYRAIGKMEGYWDDLFLLTSLHHHVSISHVRISTPYLRFLRTGKLPKKDHPFVKENSGWECLRVQKTKYWDLLEPVERAEASQALCTVLKWLSRGETKRPTPG